MIGVIGGTGMDEALAVGSRGERLDVDTPFGRPSSPITVTELDGIEVALLARHGAGHHLNPSRVPYQANVFALKKLGVTQIIATGAVGSLREEIAPRDLVVPDQIVDRTIRRPSTFFDELAVHVEMSSPFCHRLLRHLLEASQGLETRIHDAAAYLCMEGPQLSTRAESKQHRKMGADLIGMTAQPEAKLAREAEICYALLALPTDYDCWKPRAADAAGAALLKEIVGNLHAVTQSALMLVRKAIPRLAADSETCSCRSALELAIWTSHERVTEATRQKLAPLLSKYLPAQTRTES